MLVTTTNAITERMMCHLNASRWSRNDIPLLLPKNFFIRSNINYGKFTVKGLVSMDKRTKKTPTVDVALIKARKYCAYSERSKAEVEKKLRNIGVMEGDIPSITEKLIKEGFLNETRFASAFQVVSSGIRNGAKS